MTRQHAHVCNVCTSFFALAPKPARDPQVRPGSVLVADPSLGGTFAQAVVLITEVTSSGTTGLILNRPMPRPAVDMPPALLNALIPEQANGGGGGQLRIEWRKGGPACGGRVGVTLSLIHI